MAGAVALAQLGAIYLPFMNRFIYTVPLSTTDLIIAGVVSSVVFWAIEIQKFMQTAQEVIHEVHESARRY